MAGAPPPPAGDPAAGDGEDESGTDGSETDGAGAAAPDGWPSRATVVTSRSRTAQDIQCPSCPYRTGFSAWMDQHMRRLHPGEPSPMDPRLLHKLRVRQRLGVSVPTAPPADTPGARRAREGRAARKRAATNGTVSAPGAPAHAGAAAAARGDQATPPAAPAAPSNTPGARRAREWRARRERAAVEGAALTARAPRALTRSDLGQFVSAAASAGAPR